MASIFRAVQVNEIQNYRINSSYPDSFAIDFVDLRGYDAIDVNTDFAYLLPKNSVYFGHFIPNEARIGGYGGHNNVSVSIYSEKREQDTKTSCNRAPF